MSLHAVEGHEAIRESLARAQGAGTLPHALLLHGPRGVGKQRLALWLGQLAVCEAPGLEGPCGTCRSCRMALRLEHPDLHWFFPLPRPKGASSPDKLADALEEDRAERLAQLRARPLQPSVGDDAPTGIYLAAAQTLRRRAQSRPSMAPCQTFVIADAEALVPQESSQEAANALLKLLEEPPADTRFVLTSSEPGALLDTIRSRTVPVHVPALARERVADFLVAQGRAEPDQAARAARLGQGSIGRALGFLSDDDGEGGLVDVHREAYRIVEAALSPDAGAGMILALGYRSTRARGLLDLLAFVEGWLRDLAAVTAGVPERVVTSEAVSRLDAMARGARLHPEAVTRSLAEVDRATLEAKGNVNPQLIVAGLVARLRAHLRPATTEAAR